MRYIYPTRLQAQRKTPPIIFVAAISIIFFSLAGGAAMLGYQPLAQAGSTLDVECADTAKANVVGGTLGSETNSLRSSVAGSREVPDADGFSVEMPSVEVDNAAKDFRVFITKA